jgi:predicted metal-dependent peptidase
MAKLFYDHLIVIEEITAVLDEHKLTAADRVKILTLMDATLQHEILDVIFTYLPRDKHDEFLTKFHKVPHDLTLMQYLKDNSPVNIELAILDRANKTKKKLLREVNKYTYDRKA